MSEKTIAQNAERREVGNLIEIRIGSRKIAADRNGDYYRYQMFLSETIAAIAARDFIERSKRSFNEQRKEKR